MDIEDVKVMRKIILQICKMYKINKKNQSKRNKIKIIKIIENITHLMKEYDIYTKIWISKEIGKAVNNFFEVVF